MEEKNKLALIISYYLSKFDVQAVENLGYKSFSEAFREISAILDVKPNTIKQMREQFDPYHDNPRVGWYQRELTQSRRDVMDYYGNMSEEALTEVVKEILAAREKSNALNLYIKVISDDQDTVKEMKEPYNTRGITGVKAEEMFLELYENGEIFRFRGELRDTRLLGTGYDFEMKESPGYVFEIKGLKGLEGGITFTDKEWTVAKERGDHYFLVVIRNVDHDTDVTIIQNPFKELTPVKSVYTTLAVNWNVNGGQLFLSTIIFVMTNL